MQSPASLFDILGTRSGRGSTWLEVDLRFKLNLGPVRVSGATIRATLNENGTIDASLRGLDASLEVPGAIKGRGAVQILPSGGITAALDVSIVPLNLSTDGVILYEPKNDTFWLFVQVGVDLPAAIPIANSGLGIYGISGAFGINARPKPPAPADPDPIGYQLRWNSADPVNAFEFRADNMTFGAQAVVFELAQALSPHSGHSARRPSSTRSWAPHTGQKLHRLSSGTACNDRAVSDQTEPTDEEHEQAPERQPEEEAMRGVDPDQLDDEGEEE